MYCFNSDYTEGCHPAILEKLVATNMEQTTGYGMDSYCDEARELERNTGDKWTGPHIRLCVTYQGSRRIGISAYEASYAQI